MFNKRVNFISNLESKKIHPAIEYFHQLQSSAPSRNLKEILSSFDKPRSIDSENFAAGVKEFIHLANSNPLANNDHSGNSRKALYGNIYSGLHYNNHLVKLWNDSHADNEPIKAWEVSNLVPSGWNSTPQDGFNILIYRGQQPAQALDQLVKGPTVIDCGMFAQLSLWFGIRYLLGNERFNQCFGRAPFFITQGVYNAIEECNEPYSGNPLHSFLSIKEQAVIPSVTVKYLSNTPLYPFKHPGGNGNGQNCVLMGEHYSIFAPLLEHNQGLTKSTVLNILRDGFNQERTQYDNDRLSIYAANPNEVNPHFFQTCGQLIEISESLREAKLTEEEFLNVKQDPQLELTFDLHKLSTWLQTLENNAKPAQIEYLPGQIDHSLLPIALLNVIPFENRTAMDFSKFKQQTTQQKELMAMSKQFCHSVMAGESKLLTLSGKAGVGKTAAAACAAKELAARGKKVMWISEVMVRGWADQAKSITDLDNCAREVDKLLATDPDAVFLDDDNLAGFSGQLLLEKIYAWYVKHPGKGLFITSNEPICFKACFGYSIDGKYHYPPFCDYNSSQYLNSQYKNDLAGESLRSKQDGQSIGAIVSNSAWKIHENKLGDIELIPGFDEDKELAPIRRSLRKTQTMGNTFNKLRPIQQQWIHVHEAGGMYLFSGRGHPEYVAPFLTANPNKFEKTTCKTIALEIKEYNSSYYGKQIDYDSMQQLMRVLNYAHDQGGRRIILINQTSFSAEQLLTKIKTQLPSSESERTWSRLKLLLCETENSIFKYEQYNGRIENNTPEKNLVNKKRKSIEYPHLFGKKRFFTDLMDSESSHDSLYDRKETNENKMDSLSIFDSIKLLFFPQMKRAANVKSDGLHKQKVEFLIHHRHDNTELQHEYDKRFGIILKK